MNEIAFAALGLILFFLVFNFLLPKVWRIALALFGSIFQVYTIPILGVYPSLCLLASLSLWPDVIKNKRVLMWLPILLIACLMVVQSLSLFWSVDKRLGVRTLVYTLPFITIACSVYGLTLSKSPIVKKIFIVILPLVLVEAGLVVIFRLFPAAEDAFLHSTIATFFTNPNTLAVLFTDARNNVLDPLKAGGFFVNANVAAGYLGIAAFSCWGIGHAYKVRWLQVISVFLWAAVWFTGSKAGIIMAYFLPLLYYLYYLYLSKNLTFKKGIIGVFSSTVISILLTVLLFGNMHVNPMDSKITKEIANNAQSSLNVQNQDKNDDTVMDIGNSSSSAISKSEIKLQKTASDVLQQTADTTNIRFKIWRYGWHAFQKEPFVGQGFGGWQKDFPQYAKSVGIGTGFPPHNTIIYLWSQSGILAAIIGLLFMLSIIRFGFKFASLGMQELTILGMSTAFAFLWAFIQGMGTNWGLLGEIHMQPLLAAMLGFTYARYCHLVEGKGGIYGERHDISASTL